MVKIDIPAIPFARAYEAVISASGKDKERIVTYHSVSVEVFEHRGLRLISSDGYLSARAWVPLDETTDSPEPSLAEEPDEQFVVIDADHRGLGLLKHVRKNLKAEWVLKAKEENPDTSPTLRIETRSPHRNQGVLEGMDLPLFYIDFPDHEIVALAVINADFVDWRTLAKLTNTPTGALKGLSVGCDQLSRINKIAKLYPTYPVVMDIHEQVDVVSLQIGPIRGVMKTADAVAAEKEQLAEQERQAELADEEAAYDEDEEEDE